MTIDKDGPRRPQALIVGGDRRTQMLVHVLLAEMGYTICVASTVVGIPAAAAPDQVQALVVIRTEVHTSTTRLVMGLRQRGYRAPLVVLLRSANRRLRQRAFLLGVEDVISLPAREHELAVRLRLALAVSSGTAPAHLRVVRPDDA